MHTQRNLNNYIHSQHLVHSDICTRTCRLKGTLTPWMWPSVDGMKLSALEIGSTWAERAGQGELGGCTRRVATVWLSLGSALKTPWLVPGGLFLSSMHQQVEKTVLSPCWAPIPGSEAFSLVWTSGCRLRAMTIASSLMGGCGWVTNM